jgi:hypothetical protein
LAHSQVAALQARPGCAFGQKRKSRRGGMAKPTAEKAFEMRSRRLIKDIWGDMLKRDIDELKSVKLIAPFMTITTQQSDISIHRNLFDDYFEDVGSETKATTITFR